MSFAPTTFRPFVREGWGGRAASHFRGCLSIATPWPGLPIEFPQTLGLAWRGNQTGTVVYRGMGGRANFSLVGVSRDSAGAILGSCIIDLMYTAGDVLHLTTTSDASGNFRFDTMPNGPFYLVAYKPGSPDVAGTTVNTLATAVV